MEMNIIRKINYAKVINTGILFISSIASSHAAILINEIDYDQPGSDTAEFIELFNPGISPLLLDGYSLDLVNGSNGSIYNSFDLTGLTISANGYLVLCDNTLAVANCDTDVGTSGWIQNGGTDGDAIALLFSGTIVDSVVYKSIGSFLGIYAEGGSFTITDSNSITMSIARLPNGIDSNINAGDFDSACITPGSSNISGTGNCTAAVSPVPVPAAAWLFGSGLLGLIGVSRRKKAA